MNFPVSTAPSRAPMMARMQLTTIRKLSSTRFSEIGKLLLASWYYINEDKNNQPEFIKWVYRAAKLNIERTCGAKVGALNYGGSHLYRKASGPVGQCNHVHKINVGVIADFMRREAANGNAKYVGYLKDVDDWFDSIMATE